MSLQILPASAVPPEALHRTFTESFSDYLIGPFDVPFAQWPMLLGRQCVDLERSRVAMNDGQIAAFAFVAPRVELSIWRLATMGAPPDSRGSGAAPMLLDDFIARAREVGCGAELECFEQNTRALKLYRSRGFEVTSPLYGYSFTSEGGGGVDAETPSREEAFRWIEEATREMTGLPLQVTPRSLRALPVDLHAMRRGRAQIVWSLGANGTVTIHSLIDKEGSQHDAQALVRTLVSMNQGRKIVVPQLQRPDAGGDALEREGFERMPLNQVLMRTRT